MKNYLVTIEVRVRVPADDEQDAKVKATVGVLDASAAERENVEWLGQDVVCCEED